MLPLTYFLKVMLCSAAFFGYYLIVLRNKKIHQFNRFYLLISVAASWVIPLIKFEITTDQKVQQPIYHAISFITEKNAGFELEPNQKIIPSFNWMQLLPVFYFVIAGIVLSALVISLIKIYSIYKKYPNQKLGNIVLLNTAESGTPFSFFNYIFWNKEIDKDSNTGRHIFQHELTHVKERHSLDKLFIQLNLVFGYFNPCFWLIQKELGMIHEFIADNKAITNSNATDFASMLLAAAFPSPKYKLINQFYYSPIKRRLTMLTQNKNPRFSYLRKLIVLPLLAIVVSLFAFRNKESSNLFNESKKYKIVLDAGHGGSDLGCVSADGTVYEKDVNLAIVKAIKQLNTNKNIEIILTREDDHFDDVKAKAAFINNQKADMSFSVHCGNAGKNVQENGVEIYVVNPDKNNAFINESNNLGQSVNGFIKNNFVTQGVKTKTGGIWILQATQCPAILIEVGYLSNKNDAAMLSETDKRELIAADILKGVENFLALKEKR